MSEKNVNQLISTSLRQVTTVSLAGIEIVQILATLVEYFPSLNIQTRNRIEEELETAAQSTKSNGCPHPISKFELLTLSGEESSILQNIDQYEIYILRNLCREEEVPVVFLAPNAQGLYAAIVPEKYAGLAENLLTEAQISLSGPAGDIFRHYIETDTSDRFRFLYDLQSANKNFVLIDRGNSGYSMHSHAGHLEIRKGRETQLHMRMNQDAWINNRDYILAYWERFERPMELTEEEYEDVSQMPPDEAEAFLNGLGTAHRFDTSEILCSLKEADKYKSMCFNRISSDRYETHEIAEVLGMIPEDKLNDYRDADDFRNASVKIREEDLEQIRDCRNNRACSRVSDVLGSMAWQAAFETAIDSHLPDQERSRIFEKIHQFNSQNHTMDHTAEHHLTDRSIRENEH